MSTRLSNNEIEKLRQLGKETPNKNLSKVIAAKAALLDKTIKK